MARGRMLRAYCMMLDFFGIELKDKLTGKLQRGKNWRERLAHLNRFTSFTAVIVCVLTLSTFDCA